MDNFLLWALEGHLRFSCDGAVLDVRLSSTRVWFWDQKGQTTQAKGNQKVETQIAHQVTILTFGDENGKEDLIHEMSWKIVIPLSVCLQQIDMRTLNDKVAKVRGKEKIEAAKKGVLASDVLVPYPASPESGV